MLDGRNGNGASDSHEDPMPAGDGTADVEADVSCPYCGEVNTVALDPGSGAAQEYLEDCQVCCRAMQLSVTYHADGSASVRAESIEDE